ncbi:8737_t:CDS:2 [Funneliformis caledonium]|uniref:8737_t:CDS:1 n=1 Tax=Funneliformis caledonium TaxID=1117310 RepID=A0A9N9F181_9GLOM|nr:8737_t:CDS:2 [Funneliformis caledonium]
MNLFTEKTKKQVAKWRDFIQNKHKDDDDEIVCNDPLLIIEYNQPGLLSRNITENNVGAVIRGTPYYTPIAYPRANLTQSNSLFAFNDMQTMEDAITRLYDTYHNDVIGRQVPIVGRVYIIEFRRANTFEVFEQNHVFD